MTEVELMDGLKLLLGNCEPARLASARRVTTAMRLLLANTREGRSPSAAVRAESARDEFDSHRRMRLGDRLVDLLAHLSRALTPGDSFLLFPAPRDSYTSNWTAILEMLSESDRDRLGLEVPLPSVCLPSVAGDHGLRRILESHGQHAMAVPGGIEELRHLHWRARAAWILDGARGPFLESLRRIAERARPLGDGEARSLLDGILGDTLALHLDGAALVPAMEIVRSLGWHEAVWQRSPSATSAPPKAVSESRGRAYGAMASWLHGATDVVPELGPGSVAFGGEVPDRWKHLLACVGSPTTTSTRKESELPWTGELSRRALGARALVVRTFRGARGLRVVYSDVAPALKDVMARWERSRQFAASEPGSPEHVMVEAGRGASAIVPRSAEPFQFGLGGEDSVHQSGENRGVRGPLAVICEPLFDRSAELVGCLWLEFDHRLLPPHRSVAAAAKLAMARVTPAPGATIASTPCERPLAGLCQDDPWRSLRSAWAELMERILAKTQERQWAAFHWGHIGPGACVLSGSGLPMNPHGIRPGSVVCVAMGGDGDLGEWTGRAESLLRRSMGTSATIRYGGSGQGAASFDRAVQGASIPLVSGGAVIGALVVESSRRGDLSAEDIGRWSAALNQSVGALELAIVHGRDSMTGGRGGFALEVAAPDADAWLSRVRTLSRAQSDVLIIGELGSGRRAAAWAIHHAGAILSDPGPLQTIEAFGLTAQDLEQRLRSATQGSLVLAGVEALDHGAQGVLADWMEAPSRARARLLATSRSAEPACPGSAPSRGHGGSGSKIRSGLPAEVGSEGRIGAELRLEHRQLATSLMRAVLRVLPLRDRRHWIPCLATAILARIAVREGGEAPTLHDDAAALVWRQPWPGNALDLEALLYGAFLGPRERGEEWVTALDLASAFQGLGTTAIGRLASRDPNLRDLAAALWTTRTASGRINKTRAALYLGWDPATVATRIREVGFDGLEAVSSALQ